jgi:hypothetical protein
LKGKLAPREAGGRFQGFVGGFRARAVTGAKTGSSGDNRMKRHIKWIREAPRKADAADAFSRE